MKKEIFFKYCYNPKTREKYAEESTGYHDTAEENAVKISVIYEYHGPARGWTVTEKTSGLMISNRFLRTRKDAVKYIYHNINGLSERLEAEKNKPYFHDACTTIQAAYNQK